jgi:hypothetical protein
MKAFKCVNIHLCQLASRFVWPGYRRRCGALKELFRGYKLRCTRIEYDALIGAETIAPSGDDAGRGADSVDDNQVGRASCE